MAVDKKITDLTADVTPDGADLLTTVDDPGGTPTNKKATIANVVTKGHGLADGAIAIASGAMTSAGEGVATQVLTSNGPGVAPTFQASGGGGESLAATLAIGNTTGGTDIEMTAADSINATSTDLLLTTTTSGDVKMIPATNVEMILPAAGKVLIDAFTTENTGIAGALDINFKSASGSGKAVHLVSSVTADVDGASVVKADLGKAVAGALGGTNSVILSNISGNAGDGSTTIRAFATIDHTKNGGSATTRILNVQDTETDQIIFADSGDFEFNAYNPNINATGGTITLKTTTTGNVTLAPADKITFTDGNKGASTYAGVCAFSDLDTEWDLFDANFGEVSVINAINQAATTGGETLAATLVLGNSTGGTNIEVTSGDAVNATSADLTLKTTTTGDVVITPADNTTVTAGVFQTFQGGSVASANDMAVPTGNYFVVTGSTQINTMAITDIQAGTFVTLAFGGVLTVKHNTAGTGAKFVLDGGGDFLTTDGATLTVVYDGIFWRETSRTAL